MISMPSTIKRSNFQTNFFRSRQKSLFNVGIRGGAIATPSLS